MDGSTPARASRALAEAGAAFAYLFGSRAAGRSQPSSDLDIAIMPSRALSLAEQGHLAAQLAGAFEVPDVDLVLLDGASLELEGTVVQTGRPIHSTDEPARVRFEVRTRSEYLDYLPTLEMHTRSYLRRVAQQGF